VPKGFKMREFLSSLWTAFTVILWSFIFVTIIYNQPWWFAVFAGACFAAVCLIGFRE
jgi:hypothetical protein